MEVNIGVIRDRQGIHAELLRSESTSRQLAICYISDGKLIVKISVVKKLKNTPEGIIVLLGATANDPPHETVVPLDQIQSIYPISDFVR